MIFEDKKKIFFIAGILAVFLIGSAVVFGWGFNLGAIKANLQEKTEGLVVSDLAGYVNSVFQKIQQPREILPDYLVLRNDLMKNSQDFLEINLVERKVYFYQQGQIIKTAEILKTGDVQNWGGTPSGLYKVLAKYKEAYSPGADAYMPYALKFYGKYFLHGKPYYAGGAPYLADFSGGCVQIADQDAKEIFALVDVDLPVLVIDQENTQCLEIGLSSEPFLEISAQNYLIADLDCGEVLAQKNSQEKIAIGSLLDFLEAVVIAEKVDLRDDIIVSTKAEQMSCGQKDILQTGSHYWAVDLFYPLLAENSTRAKWVLAAFLGRQKMPQLMQEKAKAIMMLNTQVSDIFDCQGANSTSTSQDLFYLARYLQNSRPPLLAMSKSEKVRIFGVLPFELENLSNQNIFSDDENFLGGKVSAVNNSRYNGMFVFRLIGQDGQERNIVIILLGENSIEKLESDVLQIKTWLE